MSELNQVFVGLGANIGEPFAQLESALNALARLPESTLVRSSSFYQSPPWGIDSQPPFVNAVAELSTSLSPEHLMASLLAIEHAAGRQRALRWGPRVLDLDLLMFGDFVIEQPGLRVPHPHLHQRAFVLVPLHEIAPRLVVPGLGAVSSLLQSVDCTQIKAVSARSL
ncbi:MAG: 2-amino-4-hydroxy-6-hydroxymethyldihydropteridine diphosphokinase [Pseudomarimonas sp.]